MRLADIVTTAFGNLMRRKLRATLTSGGVAIGIAALTLIVALVTGAREFTTTQASVFLAPNAIMVVAERGMMEGGGPMGMIMGQPPREVEEGELPFPGPTGPPQSLKPKQVAALEELPHIEAIYPQVSVSAHSIRLEGAEKAYSLQVRSYYPGDPVELVAGRHSLEAEREVVLAYPYLEVFGWSQPEEGLGRRVTLTLVRFQIGQLSLETREFEATVVGVTAETLASTAVFVPYQYAVEMSRWQQSEPDLYTPGNFGPFALLYVADAQWVEEVAEQVEDLGMGASTQSEFIGMLSKMFTYIEGVLGLFGLIALVVASLGVANTMVMAVYERTHEIGVLKALGAGKNTIRSLFSTEAALNGLLGALVGIAIAWLGGMLINLFAARAFGLAGFTFTIFPYWLILGAIGFGTLIAWLAGILPANRAANLDPIEALRYE